VGNEPYGTISIKWLAMSSERARRFYLLPSVTLTAPAGPDCQPGETFRPCSSASGGGLPRAVTPAPRPRPLRGGRRYKSSEAPSAGSSANAERSAEDSASVRRDTGAGAQRQIAPQPDDEYAATGIGRSVHNDVRWVDMELDSRPGGGSTIRYEYYPALVRLGILREATSVSGSFAQTRRRERFRGQTLSPGAVSQTADGRRQEQAVDGSSKRPDFPFSIHIFQLSLVPRGKWRSQWK